MNFLFRKQILGCSALLLLACGSPVEMVSEVNDSISVPSFGKKYAYVLVDEIEAGLAQEASSFESSLKGRGYQVIRVNRDAVNTVAKDISKRNLSKFDKVVLILQGHGGHVGESRGIYSTPADWAQHWITLKDPNKNASHVSAQELGGLVSTVRGAGASAVVVDASCSGGATVKHLEHLFPQDERLCAIATTGAFTVGAVGFPKLGSAAGRTEMKTWDDIGAFASSELVNAAKENGRVHQWGYRNGCTQTMRVREGASTAASAPTMWWHWNRMRDVHVLIHPERYFDKDPANTKNQYYAPEPNYSTVDLYTSSHSQKWINDFSSARNEFLGQVTAGHTASFKQTSESLIQVANQSLAALKNLDDQFRKQKVGDKSLGNFLRGLLRDSTCTVRGVPRVEIVRAIPDLSIIYQARRLDPTVWNYYLESGVRTRSGVFTPVIRPILMPDLALVGDVVGSGLTLSSRDRSAVYSMTLCQKGMRALMNTIIDDYPVLKAPLENYENLLGRLLELRKATGQSLTTSEGRLCPQSAPCKNISL